MHTDVQREHMHATKTGTHEHENMYNSKQTHTDTKIIKMKTVCCMLEVPFVDILLNMFIMGDTESVFTVCVKALPGL